jgi:chitinase
VTLIRALLFSLCLLPSAVPAADLFDARGQAFKRDARSKVVGVYVPNWQPPAQLDALRHGSASHLLYAFLRLCGPGQLPADEKACSGRRDFEIAPARAHADFDAAFARLKQREPGVQVLASVGGWGGSDPFFHLANDATRRAAFAASAAGFLRTHAAFDGIDIDWEHPTSNGSANGVALGTPEDGRGYALLMHELRKALDALGAQTGRRYLLTSAINTTSDLVRKIDYRDAQRSLDLVFMMSYDFYGPWSSKAGHHTAVRGGADDSLEGAIASMTAAGVPAHKLVAGVAMYARGFVLGPKLAAYPGSDGSLTYRELAALYLDREGRGTRGWQSRFDERSGSWTLVNERAQLMLGYDDPRAVLEKGRLAMKQGLAGVFAWELTQDNGDLLEAMNLGVGHAPRGFQR